MTWNRIGIGVLLALGCGSTDRDETTAVTGAGSSPTASDSGTGSHDTDGHDDGDSASSQAEGDDDAGDGGPLLDVGGYATEGFDPDAPMTCDQDVDIVFVMDVSTSMDAFLDKLAQEILVVNQALAALDLPGEPHYGLVVFVDDYALLSNGAPYPDVQTLQADFTTWSDFTSSNNQVDGGGSNSTWPENSIDGLHVAASAFQWRPAETTLRMIIHTTDDTFWDGPTTGNGVMIEHGYTETVEALQQAQIRVFSFAADIGGSCNCDDVTPGWSAPYMGLEPIPVATDGAVFDIQQVLSGAVSLSAAINEAVEESMCDPYTPQG